MEFTVAQELRYWPPATLAPVLTRLVTTLPYQYHERTVPPQVGLLAGVIFVRAKQLEVPATASAPKAAVKPEALLKSVSPK